MTADAWGIDDGFAGADGGWRETAPETRDAILGAMRASGETAPSDGSVITVAAGRESSRLAVRGDLVLEDGTVLPIDDRLPADVPIGYHELQTERGEPQLVIVHPARCHLPADLATWGFAAQLYAVRSRESWGIGDFADLRRLARWSRGDLGAGILLLNPLGAATPVLPQETSPYAPSSRIYRNLLYLRVEEIPGAADAGADLERLAAAGRALDRERRIDRDIVFRLKRGALELLWRRFGGALDFDRYRADQGAPLERFATFCALAERHGSGWRNWPAEHRHPDSPAVARFAEDNPERLRFHEWVQWLLDRQLAAAAEGIGLMQDLAVGFDAGGADAWTWQDLLAAGTCIGAPPDEYNRQGQNWGLPAFVPHRLRAARYEPFVRTIRAMLRHAGGLRIDHVMGLFRLFWIPEGFEPARGAYVRYPAEELLAIVAIESARAGAVIVGEDLGTVEQSARTVLRERGVLSYRLLWFETDMPESYPREALVAITTHDLPTVAGLWTRADVQRQRMHRLQPSEESLEGIRTRLAQMSGLAESASPADAVRRAYELLGHARSAIVVATLEDVFCVEERPNLPGIVIADNWSLALPETLETLQKTALARAIAAALRRGGRHPERPSLRPRRGTAHRHQRLKRE